MTNTRRREVIERNRPEDPLIARIHDLITHYHGQELFDRATESLAALLDTRYAIIGELSRNGLQVQVRAFYSHGVIEREWAYELAGTPCQVVVEEARVCACPRGVRKRFPSGSLLDAWGADAYIGAPILGSKGEVIGVIAAFDEQPVEFNENDARVLEIVAQCISLELIERQHEETVHQLQQQLYQAQKMGSVGTLAGGVAHDFNNLLTGIMGFTELALTNLEAERELSEYLNQVMWLSGQARDLVRQLLLFSRPTPGLKERCDLHNFLDDLALLLRRTIPESIQIELVLTGGEVLIKANPPQLQQVLVNLAVNARDAMPLGGRLRIETKLTSVDDLVPPGRARADARRGRYVQLTVSDTGEGIPLQVQAHIFEPFFTTKEAGKGTGLGLSVVYGIVKAHGGWIEVESEVGRGTRFHIYLPLAEQATEAADAEADGKIVGGKETILLVEDDQMVLELARKMLEWLGYRVLIARDGQEVLDVYAERQDEIDLILLDVVMPRMSGQMTFSELRAMNPEVKILLVTGYSPEDVARDLLRQGAEGLVQKPYDFKILAQAVRHCLDQGRKSFATRSAVGWQDAVH
jgi:signal transduction histidine kinase/ActR/RegA family two-component response regulator